MQTTPVSQARSDGVVVLQQYRDNTMDVLLLLLLGLGCHSKQSGYEGVISPLPTPLTCPLRSMFITSYPCNVLPAVSTEKKPIPGLTIRLIKRWSCSTQLLRYLTRSLVQAA